MIHFQPHYHRSRNINLTPLIDIIFLLIVFFMLSNHYNTTHILPFSLQSGTHIAPKTELKPNHLTLLNNQQFKLNEATHNIENIKRHINNLPRTSPIVIETNPQTSIQTMVHMTTTLKQLHFTQVTLQ